MIYLSVKGASAMTIDTLVIYKKKSNKSHHPPHTYCCANSNTKGVVVVNVTGKSGYTNNAKTAQGTCG